MTTNYYEILEVSPKACSEVIKAAYKALISKYHPDRNPNNTAAANKCVQLNKAYETLSDADKKRQYDATVRPPHVNHQGYGQRPQASAPYKYTPPDIDSSRAKPYTHDEKWETFLEQRAVWAKNVTPPAVSWNNPQQAITQAPGGFVYLRPDLELWSYWLVNQAKLSHGVTRREVENEIVKTVLYFCPDSSSLTQAAVRKAAIEFCNKTHGSVQTNGVMFGV